jgi:GTP cyclohydrolase I
MNAPDPNQLADVQSNRDHRNLAIQRVGIKDVTHPIEVQTASGTRPSVASIDVFVGLAAGTKGTHMSRFLEVLQAHTAPISPASTQDLMRQILDRLEAETGHIALRFPYFVSKAAPVSGAISLMDYQVTLKAQADPHGTVVTLQVLVPVTSLCPCSKSISAYGAHNQRSHITIAVDLTALDLRVETLIDIAEQAASCPLWGLLKRPDEKYVTERAYDNPKFVEDLVRDVASAVAKLPGVARYWVEAENFESIHNHSAYAQLSGAL